MLINSNVIMAMHIINNMSIEKIYINVASNFLNAVIFKTFLEKARVVLRKYLGDHCGVQGWVSLLWKQK